MNRLLRIQPLTFFMVIAAHVFALGWVAQHAQSIQPMYKSSPMMVSLLQNEQQPRTAVFPEQHFPPKKSVPALTVDSSTALTQPANKHTRSDDLPARAEPRPSSAEPVTASAHAVALTEARFDVDYLRNPAPQYPLLSSRLREEGTVYLRVRVHAEGYAASAEIKDSSGYTRLDLAALAAVKQWRFISAQQNGQAVDSWVIIPLHFFLKR